MERKTSNSISWLPPLVLSLVIILITLPWLTMDFLNEDANNIALGNHAEAIWQPELTSGRPVEVLSYVWDAYLWGISSVGYHVTNIILHLSVSILFWIFLLRIGTGRWLSVLIMATWAVSSVPWSKMAFVFGRLEPIWLIPGLIAILLHLGHHEKALSPGGWRFLAILALLSLSFGAKIIALMFWPALIILDLAFRPHRFSIPQKSYTFVGYFLSGLWMAVLLGIRLLTYGWGGYGEQAYFSIGNWIFNNLFFFWQLTILPFTLEPDIVAMLIAFALVFILFMINRQCWIGCVWFLIFIIPVISLPNAQLWYNYVPSLALPLMLATASKGKGRITGFRKHAIIIVTVIVVFTLSLKTDYKVWNIRMAGTELNHRLIEDLKKDKNYLLSHFIPFKGQSMVRKNSIVHIFNLPEFYREWKVYPESLGYVYTNIILKQGLYDNPYARGDEPVVIVDNVWRQLPMLSWAEEVKRRVFIDYRDEHFLLLKDFGQAFSKVEEKQEKSITFDFINRPGLLKSEGGISLKCIKDGLKVILNPQKGGYIYVDLPVKANILTKIGFYLKLETPQPVGLGLIVKYDGCEKWSVFHTKYPIPSGVWFDKNIDQKLLGLIISPFPFTKFGMQVPPGQGCLIISRISLGIIEL